MYQKSIMLFIIITSLFLFSKPSPELKAALRDLNKAFNPARRDLLKKKDKEFAALNKKYGAAMKGLSKLTSAQPDFADAENKEKRKIRGQMAKTEEGKPFMKQINASRELMYAYISKKDKDYKALYKKVLKLRKEGKKKKKK